MARRSLIFFLLASLLPGCFSYSDSPRLPFVRSITEDDEIRISREFRRDAKKNLKLVSHPEVERYVDQVGRRLLAPMGPQPFEYRFFVVEDSQLNAFAVPGGSIYIHTGLLQRLSSTDELAGVLGHEIVHVKARHVARVSGPDPAVLLGLLAVFLGRGPQAQAGAVLGQALAVSRQLSYSRQLEQEADALGVRYMAEAGYDPKAALDFLKVVDQERIFNPVDLPPYLLTHPLTQERITTIEALVRAVGSRQPRASRPDPIQKVQTLLRLERHEADALIAEYERLGTDSPGNPVPPHLLGIAYEYKGRWPEARERYERARSLNANGPGIDRDLGRLYTKLGDFGQAHEAFERALKHDAREPLNYLYLGELFDKEGNLPDAVGAFLRAHNLAPLWYEPPYRLGVVYGKMNRLGDAYYYLARANLLSDEEERAIADFERAIKALSPASPRGQIIREEIEAIKARRK